MIYCSGLNYVLGEWYSVYIQNKKYVFCEYCSNKYSDYDMTYISNEHNFKAKCDSYIMTDGVKIGAFTIYLYNETKTQLIEKNISGKYKMKCGMNYYIYILSELNNQYYSVDLGNNEKEMPVLYKTDSLFAIKNDQVLYCDTDNNFTNDVIYINITVYDYKKDTSLFSSGINLGEFKYDSITNKISLITSDIKHKVSYNISSEEVWSPPYIYIPHINKYNTTLFLFSEESPNELAESNKEYRRLKDMKLKHNIKVAEYSAKEYVLELKNLYNRINNLCH